MNTLFVFIRLYSFNHDLKIHLNEQASLLGGVSATNKFSCATKAEGETKIR